MTRINVKTAAKVIDVLSDALGGAKQFRRCYRVNNRQRVSNWRRFGQIPAVFRDAMKEDLEELGYEAPGALWGQYEHRKRPKKKPKPVTTGRQGKQNGGANGRNGKRQRAGTQKMARLAHRRTCKTVGNGVGLDDRRLVGHDPQCGDRQGQPTTSADQETTG